MQHNHSVKLQNLSISKVIYMLKYFPKTMFDIEKVNCICVKVPNTKVIHAKMLNICKRRFVAFQDVLPVELCLSILCR